MHKLELKYHSTDSGDCRVYYKSCDKTIKLLYCLQKDYDTYKLYICSRDGEPSHEVNDINNYKINPSNGSERIDREVNEFLERLVNVAR